MPHPAKLPSPAQPAQRIIEPKLVSSSLELIGKTPLVRLRAFEVEGGGEVWAKCEQYNPGGSVKDRIALSMIEAAEAAGALTVGESIVVEPTSGNTGIGLALVCAAKGYELVLTMPESMSLERRALLESYGAKIIMTPADAVMEGALERARALCKESSAYFMPDQFANPANPAVHRETTGPEIVAQLGGRRIDGFVSAIGTGGTISGVGAVLRDENPNCKVVGVEPARSAVLSGDPPGPHKIQGIGAGFVPEILNRAIVSEMRTVLDIEAYRTKRDLAHKAGLLVGISAGANVFVASQLARELGEDAIVVTILCDTGERYFSLDTYFQARERA